MSDPITTSDGPPDDDWMNNPAAPPVSLDPAFAKGETPGTAPKRGRKPHLRPVEQLAAEIGDAPIAGAAKAAGGAKGKSAAAGAAEGPQEGEAPPAEDVAPEDRGGQRKAADRPRGEIWKGCPVKPLGYLGGTYYYLDPLGQLRGLTKHDAQAIMMLFAGKLPRLFHGFPKMVQDRKTGMVYRKPEHFEQQLAAAAMIAACGERGLFNPDGAVRGVGAWADDDGTLVYHTGDSLLIGAEVREPASHQGRIYPAYPPIPHPAAAGTHADAAAALLEQLETWQWDRPEVDPMITLAMVCIMIMGGALTWRPAFWVTGGKEAGKSEFHKLIKFLLGEKGLVQSTDPTKSGITSRLGHSSLPVALDELEPDEAGSGKEKAIILLARVASSGGEWLRGSADQKGASGNVYSTFLFSSILITGELQSQDLSRLVVLSLNAFPEGTPPLHLRPETWRNRGAVLKRQLIDRWPTWANRLDLWRGAFAEHKITGRVADNYATIFAMGHMALSEALPTAEEMASWTAKAARHIRASVEEIGSDADEVVTHLLSQQFDPFRRGERLTVAAWLKAAAWRPQAGRRMFAGDGGDDTPYAIDDYAKRANKSIAALGLRVIGTPEAPELFVATKQMQGLKDLFQRSKWSNGVWTQSLKRIKGAYCSRASRFMDGAQTKGTIVPFTSLPGLMAFDGDEAQASAAAPTPMQAGSIVPDVGGFY